MKKVKSEKVKRSKKLYKPKEDISLYSHENDDHGVITNREDLKSGLKNTQITQSETISKKSLLSNKKTKVKFKGKDIMIESEHIDGTSIKKIKEKINPEVEDFSNDLTKKKEYISRRTKNYDDSASDD